MIHETIAVYRSDSIRNGSQKDLPVFGRFGAIVRVDSYRLSENDSGWYVGLPYGSVLWSGDGTEHDAKEAWDRIKKMLSSGKNNLWTTDRKIASREAIAAAARRHNKKVAESRSYTQKFGGHVNVK